VTNPFETWVYRVGATAARRAVPTIFLGRGTTGVAAKRFAETDLCRSLRKRYLTPTRSFAGFFPKTCGVLYREPPI